jgi:hypothetical protein
VIRISLTAGAWLAYSYHKPGIFHAICKHSLSLRLKQQEGWLIIFSFYSFSGYGKMAVTLYEQINKTVFS